MPFPWLHYLFAHISQIRIAMHPKVEDKVCTSNRKRYHSAEEVIETAPVVQIATLGSKRRDNTSRRLAKPFHERIIPPKTAIAKPAQKDIIEWSGHVASRI